jgi:hypothetical protein
VQEIRVVNTGDAMADLAWTSFEILVPPSSPISLDSSPDMTFQSKQNPGFKQYRFEDCQNPKKLYPVKDDSFLIGSLRIPARTSGKINVNVQIAGIQGGARKKLTIRL